MAENDLSRQRLPRRPTDDYAEPSELEPPPDVATSPGRPSRPGGAAPRADVTGVVDLDDPRPLNLFNECRCGITRVDLWITVCGAAAIAVVVSELLHAL